MSPSSAVLHANGPREVAPIVPAVPRIFERRFKKQPQFPKDGEKSHQSKGTATQVDNQSCGAGQNLQIKISGDLDDQAGSGEANFHLSSGSAVTEGHVSPGDHQHSRPPSKPPAIADVGLADQPSNQHGGPGTRKFESAPALKPRKSAPSAVSTKLASTGNSITSTDRQGPVKSGSEGTGRTKPRLGDNADIPAPPVGNNYAEASHSPARSLISEKKSPEASSSQTPQSSPLDASRYPGQVFRQPIVLQREGSKFAFMKTTSNVDPCPTYSAQQKHTFGPSYDMNTSPSQFGFHLQRNFVSNSSHDQLPPFPFRGNHLPLTPSATPLEFSSDHWDASSPQSSTFLPEHQHSAAASDSTTVNQIHHQGAIPNTCPPLHPLAPHNNSPQPHSSAEMRPEHLVSSHDASMTDVPLTRYILQSFDVGTFADCRLLATHDYGNFAPRSFSLHSLLLARSPKLRELFARGHYGFDVDGLKLIYTPLNDRFITLSALEAAIRICYGESVASFNGSNATGYQPRTQTDCSISLMNESLAFVAAGAFLQLADVVSRGLEIAGTIINWDNLEHALSFALERAEHRRNGRSASVIPADLSAFSRDSDTSTVTSILTPGTSQGSAEVSPQTQEPLTQSSPIRESSTSDVRCAGDLLSRCLQFLASNISDLWEFDHAARPLPHVDRLPVTIESRSPPAKSRLRRIQFGDIPAESAPPTSGHNTFISCIILSLPFSALQSLVAAEPRAIKRNLHEIVEAREQRRLIVLQSHSVSRAQREAARHDEWIEMGYQEHVEMIDGRACLARRSVSVFQDSEGLSIPTQESS